MAELHQLNDLHFAKKGAYHMIRSISFKNFRGLKKITFTELEQITLISGKNNAGKSSILEGTFLLFDHLAPESFVKINHFRGLPISYDPNTLWEPIFYSMDTSTPVSICVQLNNISNTLEYSKDNDFIPTDNAGTPQDIWNQLVSSAKTSYTLRFKFTADDYVENGHFVVGASGILRNVDTNQNNNQLKPLPFVQYISPPIINNDNVVTEWFGQLELQGKKQQVINILKILDPAIIDISTIALRGQTQLYAKIGSKLLPLKLSGDGLNKLLFIILAIMENPNSIILIDEIESGFHYSMYHKLWNIVATAARDNNCQILATTHSYECIDGAIDGIEDANMQNNFCYYRVERMGEENRAFRYSGNLLRSAINSNMEVR